MRKAGSRTSVRPLTRRHAIELRNTQFNHDAERLVHVVQQAMGGSRTMGARPAGWYCRYGPSVNTRRLLAEAGGFTYDSDSYDDELPYWQTVQGKPHLVVPYSQSTNDVKFGRGTLGTADDFFQFCRDGFDMLYREGRTHPKMMSVGLHMRIIGHPARAAGLERLLDYVARHRDVWITRRVEIAEHWRATHPYPGRGLNEP